jgi:hypothetical protein
VRSVRFWGSDRASSSCRSFNLLREYFLSAPIHSPLSGRLIGPSADHTTQGRPNLQVRPHHLGQAAPAQLGQTSHRVSVIQENIASCNPDRRSEVDSIQSTRLASLGSMDPQTSDQPTLGNDQHSTYTKEHAPECMTRGPRAGRIKGSSRTSLTQQTDPQPPSNRLRDQITDAQSKAVKIIGMTAPGEDQRNSCGTLGR